MLSRSRVLVACLGLALTPLLGACHILSDSPSETAPTATITEVFAGTLDQRGANFYSFTVTEAGTVSVTLTSLGASTMPAVQLGVGTPGGTSTATTTGTSSCNVTSANQSVVAGPDAQMSVTATPGSYCVQIADVGNLTASSAFSITIVHP